jgi:hypothetical protein
VSGVTIQFQCAVVHWQALPGNTTRTWNDGNTCV